jgi:hypothetical protein
LGLARIWTSSRFSKWWTVYMNLDANDISPLPELPPPISLFMYISGVGELSISMCLGSGSAQCPLTECHFTGLLHCTLFRLAICNVASLLLLLYTHISIS